jgi:hypothetical protein
MNCVCVGGRGEGKGGVRGKERENGRKGGKEKVHI